MERTTKYLPAGKVKLSGRIGKALELSIANRLKKIDYSHLVDPFRKRNETDGRWRCEFWGKIVRSAIRSWRATRDEELLALIKTTVKDLCFTQTADGCISSYPTALQTQDWDIWGRKYALLGLARYYNEIDPEPVVKSTLVRALDHLISQVGPQAMKIGQCGHHNGQAASSILGAVIKVYRISGEPRFLDYAEWIVNDGGCEVFDCILQHKNPHEILNGKAYEMTSCAEGLLELSRENGNKAYLDAVIDYFHKVREQEIFITGVGGLKDEWGEFWYEGKLRQTGQEYGSLGETCVTTTYIRFALNLMRSVEDPRLADAIENSLFNGILGAMVPDGSWWAHSNPTPLTAGGFKQRAGDQIAGYGEDCCLAQGPEALACSAMYAVMQDKFGPVINHFEPCRAECEIKEQMVCLEISGDYPRNGEVDIKVTPESSMDFSIKIRIPSWSRKTVVKVNDREFPVESGSYLNLCRCWMAGDRIRLVFDMSPRVIEAKDGSGCVAIMRGPVVLARDSRLGDIDAPCDSSNGILLQPADAGFAAHESYKLSDGSCLCDYASAANRFSNDNKLCVWMRSR